jgi:hypothetical protein
MATPSISDLSASDIQQAEDFIISWLAAEYPSLDLSEGRVFRNLLIRPAAICYALDTQLMDELRQSQSLLAIEANPAIATDTAVDAVLSNYRITRQEGVKATGVVTVVMTSRRTTTIDMGAVFTHDGLTFVTTTSYVAVTDSTSVLSAAQRLITARTDGNYAFTVPVEASTAGEEYTVGVGSKFTVAPPISGFVDAFATQDFTGGTSTETNQELIDRMDSALAQPVFSGRKQIDALLRSAITNIYATSIIGFGDPEMLRDRHNIFSTSMGGKADLYVRTQALPEVLAVAKTAVLIDKVLGTWQFTVDKNDAPGFYTIESVIASTASPDTASFAILSDTRGLDLTPDVDEDFAPDVDTNIEGAYSRYQTSVVQFTDATGVLDGLINLTSTRSYMVYLKYMPGIKTLQRLACNRANRNPQADYLVRAPVPAFVSVSLRVEYTGTDEPDPDVIKQVVADRVNGIGFQLGRLPASAIYDAIHNELSTTGAYVVAPIDIFVAIHRPDGTTLNARSGNQIEVPNTPEYDTTQRTVCFFLSPVDVDVTIEQAQVVEV